MADKKLVEQIDETYEEMVERKNDWSIIIFSSMLLVFACLGVFGIVHVRFGNLKPIVLEIIVTISLFTNFVTIFLIFDKEE